MKADAPSGLQATGRRLWSRVVGDLPDGFEFDARELATLELACRQADDVAALERAVKRSGRVVVGSKGQPRLAQAVAELRQGRLAVARLLGEVELPAEDGKALTASAQRARKAAHVRWAEHHARRAHG